MHESFDPSGPGVRRRADTPHLREAMPLRDWLEAVLVVDHDAPAVVPLASGPARRPRTAEVLAAARRCHLPHRAPAGGDRDAPLG